MSGPWRSFLELLFPEKCACCRAVTGGGPLCVACMVKLRKLPAMERHPRHSGDAGCIAAVYAYAGAGGALMQAFKFRGRKSGYELLRPAFEEAVAAFYGEETIGCIVPVPMHHAARAKRGFNQAETIAQGLAKHIGVPCRPTLLEKRKTGSIQHMLPAGERAENVKGVYEVCGGLQGETVLLVDDIVTTGATLSACARELRQAGAGKVLCAAVLAAE